MFYAWYREKNKKEKRQRKKCETHLVFNTSKLKFKGKNCLERINLATFKNISQGQQKNITFPSYFCRYKESG
jgi:hypothetical protein